MALAGGGDADVELDAGEGREAAEEREALGEAPLLRLGAERLLRGDAEDERRDDAVD